MERGPQLENSLNQPYTSTGGDNLGFAKRTLFSTLNSDGTVLALGFAFAYADPSDNDTVKAGRVEVYKYESSTWTQLGSTIIGVTDPTEDYNDLTYNSFSTDPQMVPGVVLQLP